MDEQNNNQRDNKTPVTPPVTVSSDDKERNRKRTAIIIALSCGLGLLVVATVVVAVIGITSQNNNNATETSYAYITVTQPITEPSTELSSEAVSESEAATKTTQVAVNKDTTSAKKPETTAKVTKAETTVAATIEGLPPLEKTGDNILSDDPDNEYIKLIVEKNKIPAERLVAIYAVPDTGNNFVLEFNGKKDENGNLIKSPDTLRRVYQIDLDRNVAVASKTPGENKGVKYSEGLLVFYMVTNIVMPQYPDYFTGV